MNADADGLDIGFVGLGAMGWPMAANLAAARPCKVFNRTEEVAIRHAAEHGSRAVGLAEIGRVTVLHTCLPTTADVASFAEGLEDILVEGAVWVDHTSGDPAQSRALAQRLALRGVTYLDAPVSGGTSGALAGTLTMMVGGSVTALDRVRGVLGAMATRVVHVGPIGAGHAVKAVNNTLLATHLLATAEGLIALQEAGVDPAVALEVINASSGRSNASEHLFGERVLNRTFPNTFALGLLAKDCGIGQAVLDDTSTVGPMLRLTGELVRAATVAHGRDVDHSEVVRYIESMTGREIRGGGA